MANKNPNRSGASKRKRTAAEVIEAVRGSRGIMTNIALRLGVTRVTLNRYAKNWPSVRAAIDAEKSKLNDVATSVVIAKIEAAAKLVQAAMRDGNFDAAVKVDSTDSKWLLNARDPSFRKKTHVEISTRDVKEMTDEQLLAIVES